ncbi:PREDICTED: small nuclear ribonucleoprotein E-like [Amphimedon queenslandica]|uniref:Small nuclear ribonucleoprotein E n=1 Tax=Amphimedon queenslandica TaxID=400682 RepID=A0A1X7UF89_AMPQE|nr:PREDICTED: small nuclear ribonucleoprotein E-like [Amphimedon queenslandica]|eukprot:XP_003388198.1 PREDICTED: small nuclear ribonucleoprotein E-like [Amphimedon queenslandica]
MAYRAQKVQKVMVQPINLIFRYLQNKSRVQVWLYGRQNMRIEGVITGFDEFMNLVMSDAEEVYLKTETRKRIGRILLRGDNVTLIMQAQQSSS